MPLGKVDSNSLVAEEMVSSEDLVVIHPCLSIVLPQAPKGHLKISVRMTDDKSQWKDIFFFLLSEGAEFALCQCRVGAEAAF